FTLSPGLEVVDAVVNNRAGWRVDPATRQLLVTLRQPGTGGKVLITAVAPLPAGGKTTPLPVVRPVRAVVGDERVEVRVHPDLEAESLDPADYRLTDAGLAPDHGRVMTLVGSLLPPGADEPFRRPPAVRIAGAGPEVATEEGVEWRIEAGRVHLACRLGVRVRRGPLFHLALHPPPGFTLDRVTSTPDDAVAYAGPAAAPEPGVTVEFARPVPTGQRVELRLAFRGPVLPAGGTVRVPLPRFAPVDAAERAGWVSLCPGPGWSVTPRLSPGATEATEATAPPAAPGDATVTYLYRGREPEGELVLSAVRPAFTAAAETRLDLAADRLTAATRLTLKVTAGALPAVTVFEPGPVRAGRTWKVADGSNAVTAATPILLGRLPGALPVLGAPWGGLAPAVATRAATGGEPGTYWVVRFARPVSDEVSLETEAVIPGATPETARVLAGELASGRRDLLSVRGAAGHTSRVDPASPLGGAVAPADAPPASRSWSFDGLYLVTVCGEPHSLVVFGGAVAARDGPTLPIRLPAGAEVRAACAGGHWLDPGRCEPVPGADEVELRLPVPAGAGVVRFEVQYHLPTDGGSIVRRVRSPAPALPGGPHPVRRWWAYPPGALAAWPVAARTSSAAAAMPVLLGDPLDRPVGELAVVRFPGETVVVAPARLADAVGAGLAAVLVALGWVGARRGNRSVGFALMAVLIGAGVVYLVGPAAWERAARPAVVAGLPAAVAVVVARGRVRLVPPVAPAVPADSRTRSLGVVAAALLVGLVPVVASRAQPGPRDVVLILPGPAADPTRETVIAPRAVLDRLDAAARPPHPAAVITAAAYDGRAEDGTARFTARFVVHSFLDAETAVGLPLADVRLERVLVDGKPALPVAPRPDVYTVPVVGRGRHEIEAGFVVAVATAGPEREVRFGLPEVPDCRLTFTVPGSARQLQAVGRLGDQKTGPEKDAPRVEADLGAVRAAHLRWRQGTGGAAAVTVREGCVWDVSEGGSELTACYQVRVDSGSVSGFRFDLPAGLEPVRVTVRPLDTMAGAGVLRDWSVGPEAGGLRPLLIGLQGPTDGRLLVTLECVPRGAPTRQPALRFPRPVGMENAGGVYGLRATGVAVEGVTRVGVIDFAADALAREFGAIPDLRLSPMVPVLAFSPRPREAAELRPTLRPGPDPPAASQDTTWRVGPHRADGAGAIRWAAKDPVPVLEFALPGVRVFEVRGADVSGWAQTDGRVQVWFRKPAREGAVEWAGTLTPAPPGKPVAEPLPFDPPVPGLVHVRPGRHSLRVLPADGWAVRVAADRGWQADVSAEDREWRFHADGAAPPVRLVLFPPRGGPARGFGLVETGGPAVSYRGIVELSLPPNRPHHLVVRAAGLPPGATAALDLPPGTAAHDRPGDDGEREWDLDVPAAPPGVFRATVVVRLPAAGTVRLPTIWCGVGGAVPGPAGVVRYVGVTGGGRGARVAGAAPVSPAELHAIQAAW
ncbi:MAG: hypothetical protein JWO38_7026, partial [Gemmataceae bacterium]|nr:hypothetical protein [Gemmataceae bacterium]